MAQKQKIRLYINQLLCENQELALSEAQTHYLCNVLRLEKGSEFHGFDNQSGEYEVQIVTTSKKIATIKVGKQVRPYSQVPDLWLLFAPVKKDKTDFIVEKATELGVRKIMPTITSRTISERIKTERFVAQSIEACEQCRRVDLPQITAAEPLSKVLQQWDPQRILYVMDETRSGHSLVKVFAAAKNGSPAAILVGPEGGFAPEELELLRKMPFVQAVSLGSRILRAETAVAAAVSCWQAICGDWDERE